MIHPNIGFQKCEIKRGRKQNNNKNGLLFPSVPGKLKGKYCMSHKLCEAIGLIQMIFFFFSVGTKEIAQLV